MPGNANSGRRKPVALRAYEGNRSKTPLPLEPATQPVAPEMPADLPTRSRPVWDWAVGVLGFARLVQVRDAQILHLACRHYARWMQAEETVDSEGMFYQPFVTFDADGRVVEPDDPKARRAASTIKEHPAMKVSAREAQAFERCLSKLGLSPSDWVKLAGPKTKREASLLDAAG